jgi:hypothetical protein
MTFESTTARTAPAAKCWIALRIFAFGLQKRAMPLARILVPVARRINGNVEEN